MRFYYSLLGLLLISAISSCQEEEAKDEPQSKRFICTWGDSLTAGSGGDGTTYPNVLDSLLGDNYQVINCGIGGENTLTIAARQGGIPMLLAHSVELPADNSKVIIGDRDHSLISSWNNQVVRPLLQGGEATVNNCIINGIECILGWTGKAWNDPDGRYTIQRVVAADTPVMLRERSIVFTSSMQQYRNLFANVFFIGQNLGYADNADLVSQYKAMIHFSGSNNFVILGLTSGTKAERTDLETLMTKEFGAQYINLRDYLSTQGLQDAGLTPTQADKEAMEEGKTPPSLLHDHVHFNVKGYELIGQLIYKHFLYLGII
ncbi:MAG: hypothetical protein LBE13_18895 [Bacteroidales bacterium]|jgi:lysophospholipase L1-like esterase|nr:hypothetical protein [Bacteroidales bacterium]